MRLRATALSLALALVPAWAAAAPPSAVVLEYHHVATDTPASTSITPDAFEAQMDYLADNGFEVRPLDQLVARLRAGKEVPDKAVALTFDDAYRSVHTEAFPRLQERGWPFTVFVSTGYIDQGYDGYADWDALREMADAGVTIANHSVNHPHLARPRQGESEADWRARARREITQAQDRLEREVGDVAKLFAYPFGEFSPPLQRIVSDLGFVGLGQQSGAFGPGSDFTALPRFPFSGSSPSLETFAIKVGSRPLPLRAVEPASGVLGADAQRPTLRLTLGEGVRPGSVSCFVHGARVPVERVQQDPPVLAVRAEQPLQPGRTKYNCTAPVSGADRWHWYSFVWMKPLPDGSWYTE
jgi:peptidoglycan/xylan/chitin deacetylase (PgdA/CDA1 family)